MYVWDLTRKQLDELKEQMISQHCEDCDEDVSLCEVANACDLISDDDVFERYADVDFAPGDFCDNDDIELIKRTDTGKEIYSYYGYEYSIVPGEFDDDDLALVADLDDVRVVVNLHETSFPEARDVAPKLYETIKYQWEPIMRQRTK